MALKSGFTSMASARSSGPIWATTQGEATASDSVRLGAQGPQPVTWPTARRESMVIFETPEKRETVLKL